MIRPVMPCPREDGWWLFERGRFQFVAFGAAGTIVPFRAKVQQPPAEDTGWPLDAPENSP
jgi:hypothetical protein